MNIITKLVSKLTVPQKLQRIGNILELSADNVKEEGSHRRRLAAISTTGGNLLFGFPRARVARWILA